MKRNKTYLVKKNVDLPGGKDNWIIMNGYEFARFMETEEGRNRRKGFALLESGNEIDDNIIIECGEKKAKELEKDRLCCYYRKKINMNYHTLSYDWCVAKAEADDGDDIVADLTTDVETIVMNNFINEVLYEAISTLAPQQRTLVDQLFLSDTPMTLIEYAKYHGIALASAYERKERTLFRLKKYFEKYGLDTEIFA